MYMKYLKILVGAAEEDLGYAYRALESSGRAYGVIHRRYD
jgi:hypothetical protein